MTETLLNELKEDKQRVLYLLERYPQTRNNDFYLQLMYMRTFTKIPMPYVEWRDIQAFSPKVENVGRVRRKIQNDDGMFPPTDQRVLEKRQKREKRFRKAIRKL